MVVNSEQIQFQKKTSRVSELSVCPYMPGGKSPDGDAIWNAIYASDFRVGSGEDTTNC